LEPGDHRRGALGHAERRAHGLDVLQHVPHAGRVEVDHLRRTGEGCGEGGDALVADGTDVAQTLRDDDVRLELPDERLVHAVERAAGRQRVAHPPVGRLARERAAVDRTASDARLGLDLGRVVALVAHAHELVEHPDRGHDLGRRGEQRDDAHPTPASCASPSRRAALGASGRFWPAMPRWPRRTRPTVMSCPRTHFAVSIGTLKLRPWAPRIIAVLMPTTRPRLSTSGPPELPGLRATSLWMMPSIRRPEVARMVRP